MKAISTLFFTLFISLSTFAQNENNIILRSDNAERFWVKVEGQDINNTAENNMRLTHIFDNSLLVRIVFENDRYEDIIKTITFNENNTEKLFMIKRTRQGRMVAKLFSESTVGCVQYKKAFHEYAIGSNTDNDNNNGSNQNNSNTNVNNNDINININIGNENTNQNQNNTNNPQPDHYVLEGYNGEIGCDWPMSSMNFSDAKTSIANKSFDSSKIKLAKQIIDGNCFLVYQVKELVGMMDFESSKLKIAKYAYSHTFNKGQYYKVNDAFDYELTIDDLDRFIKRQ